jgi:hypothetical protein
VLLFLTNIEDSNHANVFMSDCSSLVASDGTTYYEHFSDCDRMCNDIFFQSCYQFVTTYYEHFSDCDRMCNDIFFQSCYQFVKFVYSKTACLGTAHYLLYRGRLRRNSTVIIFFHCPPLNTSKIFKAPQPPQRAFQEHKF